MDFDSLKEILSSTLDQNANNNKERFNSVIMLIDEIKSNSAEPPNAYFHLLLREKYFQLIQTIVESENELLAKFVFNLLDKFCNAESSCQICSQKEKAQFLLNVLRYIQHTHINHEMIKMEIFKFLLSNYNMIESLLNYKILLSIMEISINEWQSENRFIQSSCKALIIKYVAVVCNQINSSDLGDDLIENADQEAIAKDTYIVNMFSFLLNVFNQEYRAHDLRDLMLECMELLLNNLLIEFQSTSKNAYKISNNQRFIEFTWQQFCPSILFQFGDCGLPAKLSAPQTIAFKHIYTILIQLTGLVGGCKNMISVFEAIYQRILYYPPEQDRHHLLKLFKTYLTEKFIFGLSYCHQLTSEDGRPKDSIDFTLINLIIGFYRNCYEKSIKTPQDKILQFLSCECISSYVQLIYNLYVMSTKASQPLSVASATLKPSPSVLASKKGANRPEDEAKDLDKIINDELIELEAFNYFNQFKLWLESVIEQFKAAENIDLDLSVKLFCLNYIQQKQMSVHKTETMESDEDGESCKKKAANRRLNYFLSSNTSRVYAAIYFSLSYLFASLSDDSLATIKSSREFVNRVLAYEDAGSRASQLDGALKARHCCKRWLKSVHGYLVDYRSSTFSTDDQLELIRANGLLYKQLSFVLKQMSCHKSGGKKSRSKASTDKEMTDNRGSLERQPSAVGSSRPTEALAMNLLRHSWTYLVDVLTGYVVNTKLANVEKFLALNFDPPSTPDIIASSSSQLSMTLTDVSITLFAFKTCLDSLFRIIDMISQMSSMDKELNQLLQILQKNNAGASSGEPSANFQPSLAQNQALTLNQLICYDFILHSTIELVCNPFRKFNARNKAAKKDDENETEADESGVGEAECQPCPKITSKAHSILWYHLIETAFLCFKNQSTIDNVRKLNLYSSRSPSSQTLSSTDALNAKSKGAAAAANERSDKLAKPSSAINKSNSSVELSRSEFLFKTVYSTQNDLNEENIENIFSFEIEGKRPTEATMTEEAPKPANSTDAASDRASRKSSIFSLLSTKTQRALVLKNLFLFLNEKVVIVEGSHLDASTSSGSRQQIPCDEFNMNTSELVDLLGNSIDRYLFKELLDNLDSYFLLSNQEDAEMNRTRLEFFSCLWDLCNGLCAFSKRYLLLDKSADSSAASHSNSLRQLEDQSRYFSLNNMIIDKMDDLIIKLVAKLSFSVADSPSRAKPVQPAPYSIYSMFILELWVHVFLDYFISVCSRCKLASVKRGSRRGRQEANMAGQRSQSMAKLKIDAAFKTAIRNSATISSIISFASRRADTEDNDVPTSATSQRGRPKHSKNGSERVSDPSHQHSDYLIDLSICKKLICLIQKAFDRYNLNTNKHYLQIATNSLIKTDFGTSSHGCDYSSSSLCSTPITMIGIAAAGDSAGREDEPGQQREVMSYNGQLAEKIKSSAQLNSLSSRLLLNATANILMPKLSDNQQKEMCLIEENIHFNSVFLLPYRRLMLNRNLDAHLQDAMLTSVCELVESSATKIKTSWSCLFECISHINLYGSSRTSSGGERGSSTIQIVVAAEKRLAAADRSKESESDSVASCDSGDESSRRYVSDSSYDSNSSAVSSQNGGSRQASRSSSASSSSSSSGFSATSNISYHFDSYRIRMNTLVDIFNLYLTLSSNTMYILAKGSFAFLKCLFNYLQYATPSNLAGGKQALKSGKRDGLKKASTDVQTEAGVEIEGMLVNKEIGAADQTTELANQDDEDDEDLYSSANDYDLQQRHYHMTSNYDHLLKLANANNSNTLIKPFLKCLESFFQILIKQMRRDLSERTNRMRLPAESYEENVDESSCKFALSKPVFKMDNANEFKRLQTLPVLDSSQFVGLNLYDLSGLGIEGDLSAIESGTEITRLNDCLSKHLKEHDQQNYFKMFAFIIRSMSARILVQQDELNCVQMVELLHLFLAGLLDSKQFILVVYCLLDIVLVDLDAQIDLIEASYSANGGSNKQPEAPTSDAAINCKLSQNVFFLSNLMCKRLKKFIAIFSNLVLKIKEESPAQSDANDSSQSAMIQLGINCVYSRLTYLLSKAILRKITKFDSLIELDFLNEQVADAKLASSGYDSQEFCASTKGPNFAKFFENCFKLENAELNEKLIKSMRLFHSLSLIPFNTLINHYKEDVDSVEVVGEKNESDEEEAGADETKKDKPASKNKYSNIEVLTKKCRSAWHLHNVKKCFSLAKVLLFDEQCLLFGYECALDGTGEESRLERSGKETSKEPVGEQQAAAVNASSETGATDYENTIENNDNMLNNANDNNAKSSDGSNGDVNQLTNSNEEKSFYRDFTLKFHVPSTSADQSQPASAKPVPEKQRTMSEIFAQCEETPRPAVSVVEAPQSQSESSQVKQLNLTCFVASLRLHLNILRLISNFGQRSRPPKSPSEETVKRSVRESLTHAIELVKCFNKTYLFSLSVDRMLSFKILISKIFYLNYEQSLANFVHFSKLAYLNICSVYFDFLFEIEKTCDDKADKDVEYEFEFEVLNDSTTATIMENFLAHRSLSQDRRDQFCITGLERKMSQILENLSGRDESCIGPLNQYFIYFVQHFSKYYYYLNEGSHNFKLNKTYLKSMIEKFKGGGNAVTEPIPERDLSPEPKEEEAEKAAELEPSSEPVATTQTDQTSAVDQEVIRLFKLHKQHNKALTMLNLTKQNETKIKISGHGLSTDDSGENAASSQNGSEERPDSADVKETNDRIYSQRDSRFRYQIWSGEMISRFLLYLNEAQSSKDAHTKFDFLIHLYTKQDQPTNVDLLNSLSQMIVVFNSCSSYCDCSIIDLNSRLDLNRIRDISARLLTAIFKIYKSNLILD